MEQELKGAIAFHHSLDIWDGEGFGLQEQFVTRRPQARLLLP